MPPVMAMLDAPFPWTIPHTRRSDSLAGSAIPDESASRSQAPWNAKRLPVS